MEKNTEYINIEKMNLAQALNWMGFKYYIWNNEEGKKLYGFENTEKFQKAFNGLLQLRKELNK